MYELLLGEECAEQLSHATLNGRHFSPEQSAQVGEFNEQCPPSLLRSRLAGSVVCFIGLILKVSLCLQLWRSPALAKSTTFPLTAIQLEVVGQLLFAAFNLRMGVIFGAYGEIYPLLLQNAFIIYCVYSHRRQPARFLQLMAMYTVLVVVWYQFTSLSTLTMLISTVGIPLQLLTQLPPLYQNMRRQNTVGFPLSMVALGLGMGLVRIWSLLHEVIGWEQVDAWMSALTGKVDVKPVSSPKSIAVLLASCIGPILSLVLLIQVLIFAENTRLLSTPIATPRATPDRLRRKRSPSVVDEDKVKDEHDMPRKPHRTVKK